ncbi:MAG: SET domain-containing protein-lysine N-methyltransferase [Candidatus Kapaibacterium sp.]
MVKPDGGSRGLTGILQPSTGAMMNHEHIPRSEAETGDVAERAASACERMTDAESGFNSLRAKRSFRKDEVITPFRAAAVRATPTYLTVQVDDGAHVELWPPQLQYTNHSCRPNCFFDTQSFELVALRDIEAGDELTFFYPSTEWHMQQSFACVCGAEECVGSVSGADSMPADLLSRYRLSPFIRKSLGERSIGLPA